MNVTIVGSSQVTQSKLNNVSTNTGHLMVTHNRTSFRLMPVVFLLIHLTVACGVFELDAAVPGITSEPQDVSASPGENAAFSVVVSNTTGTSYQWYLEASPLSSRTNATLTLVGLSTNSAGHFSVVIANTDGAATSRVASLTVTQPDFGARAVSGLNNMTSYRGQNGLLVNVTVTGQLGGAAWGTDIYTDDSTLAVAAVHAGYLTNGQLGTLIVEILPGQSSYTGTTRNGVSTLSYGTWAGSYQIVGLAPAFTLQPFSHVAWTGSSVSLSAQATASDTVSYQWKHNGSDLNGQTNTVLTLSSLSAADSGTYAITAWTTGGTNTSEVASMVIIDPTPGLPQVNDPSTGTGLSYLDGEVARVVITGSTNPGAFYGSGIYSLDSVLSLAAVHSGMLSPGEQGTLALLLLPPQPALIGSSQNGLTSSPRTYSSTAFGFLALTPTVTQHPLGQGGFSGGSAGFSVAASSRTGPLQYQWRHSGINLVDQTNSTLSLVNLSTNDSGQYDAVVSNPDGSTVSRSAPLIVLPPGTVPQMGSSACGVPIGTIVFETLVASTSGTIWGDGIYTCDSSLATAAVHAGLLASGQTGAVAVVALPGQSQYYSTTQNGVTSTAYGPWSGSYAFMGLAPFITGQPQAQSVSAGDTAAFTVSATSSAPLNYSWQKGNVPIPGQNSNILTLSNVTTNDAAQYSVVVSNQLGYATSAPATLTVTPGASLQLVLTSPGLLSLQGATGFTWQVQSRDSLTTGTWLSLGNVLVDTTPKAFTDTNSLSSSNRFYRAQKVP
jgi:hypothetical protein